MPSMQKAIIWFLIFVVVAAIISYRFTNSAYDNAYNYDKNYSYGIGNTDQFTGDPAQPGVVDTTTTTEPTQTEQ